MPSPPTPPADSKSETVIVGGKTAFVDPASGAAIRKIQSLMRKNGSTGNKAIRFTGADDPFAPYYDFAAKADPDAWTFGTIDPPETELPTLSMGAVSIPGRKALIVGGVDPETDRAGAHAFLYDDESGSWTVLPDLNGKREDPTVTRLNDGRVLITGGIDDNFETLDSAELFDPATMTFTPTPPMTEPRTLHTAALLQDGRVLIAGGDTAEIYDPQTNTFTPAADTAAQVQKVSVTLNDGRVLLAGAFEELEAQTFDPATGEFKLTGPLNEAHGSFPTMTLLPDGRVLLAGGLDLNRQRTATTDIFDPATDTFSVGPLLSDERNGHQAVLLSDHTVLLLGGYNNEGDQTDTADLFDPTDDTITQMTAKLAGGISDFTAIPLNP